MAAVRAALSAGATALREQRAAAVTGESEPVHRFRVAARRMRAAIELFAAVIHGGRLKFYRRELAWLMQAASGSRECDVTDQLLHVRAAKLE
ncbi:MAG: CHAD domain-containing protein, partial [Candidatus Binataceae bacterium]